MAQSFEESKVKLDEQAIYISKLGMLKIVTKNGLNGYFKKSSLLKICIVEKMITNQISKNLNKAHGKEIYKIEQEILDELIQTR